MARSLSLERISPTPRHRPAAYGACCVLALAAVLGACATSSPRVLVPASEFGAARQAAAADSLDAADPPALVRASAYTASAAGSSAPPPALAPFAVATPPNAAAQPQPSPAVVAAVPAPAPAAVAPSPAAADSLVQGRWIRVDRVYPPRNYTMFSRRLSEAVALFAEESGQTIVPSDEEEVQGKLITGEIRNKPWHVALEALLEAHGLRAVQDATTQVITIVTAQRAQVDRRPQPVLLRYLLARDLLTVIRPMMTMGADSTADAIEIYGDPETSRTLVAYASPDKLAAIRDLVAQMDRPKPQISVEARLVSVNRSAMQKIGLNVGFVPIYDDSTGSQSVGVNVRAIDPNALKTISSDGGPLARLISDIGGFGTVKINVFLDAVTGAGVAETETAPMITVDAGETADLFVGDAFILPNNQPLLVGGGYGGSFGPGGQQGGGAGPGNYPDPSGGLGGQGGQPGGQPGGLNAGGFARFETGTTLRVTPHVIGDSVVSMNIELVRDGGALSPDGRSIIGGKQSAKTRVTVASDAPIVIGGLTVNGRSRADSGIPGLSRLPLIGRLFRTEEWATQYQDLVIVLVPHVHPVEPTPQ